MWSTKNSLITSSTHLQLFQSFSLIKYSGLSLAGSLMLNETNGAPENNLSPNKGFPLFFVYKRIYNELIVNMPVLKAIVIY